MDTQTLLWVDLRRDTHEPILCNELTDLCNICSLDDPLGLTENIKTTFPDVICFEYDFPTARRLQALQQTKLSFPSIPILMITEDHSEALAIWALRARVWDYLVKPVETDELYSRINAVCELRPNLEPETTRDMILPQQSEPHTESTRSKKAPNLSILRAIDYVKTHYHEKVSISELAQRCNMSPSQFSRAFKREQGVTVRDYLVFYRLERACELLKDPGMSVGDVAFAAGFPDHSYFARMFRRHTGQSPSCYRMQISSQAV